MAHTNTEIGNVLVRASECVQVAYFCLYVCKLDNNEKANGTNVWAVILSAASTATTVSEQTNFYIHVYFYCATQLVFSFHCSDDSMQKRKNTIWWPKVIIKRSGVQQRREAHIHSILYGDWRSFFERSGTCVCSEATGNSCDGYTWLKSPLKFK